MNHTHETDELRGVDFWENHYGQSERVWSGKVNQVIDQLVAPLQPGASLDIGCGEGGDVLWLASQGWQATGVDLSGTAIERARADASAHGLTESQANFIAADLTEWTTDRLYDLVTLSFFQAPFEFPRTAILRKAAELVAPGGRLLALSHAAAPSWAPKFGHDIPLFPTPQAELEALGLDETWVVLRAEISERPVTAPDGTAATMQDTIVFLQRKH